MLLCCDYEYYCVFAPCSLLNILDRWITFLALPTHMFVIGERTQPERYWHIWNGLIFDFTCFLFLIFFASIEFVLPLQSLYIFLKYIQKWFVVRWLFLCGFLLSRIIYPTSLPSFFLPALFPQFMNWHYCVEFDLIEYNLLSSHFRGYGSHSKIYRCEKRIELRSLSFVLEYNIY